MDKICIWIEKLLLWIDRCGPPRIMWVGQAGNRFHNPPAPHIEIVFVIEGACPDLHIGDRTVSLKAGDISLHSVHFGNESPPGKGFKAWCLFLDVGDESEFESLRQTPLVCSINCSNPKEIETAFAVLAARCYLYGTGPEKGYLDPGPLFSPTRKTANVPALLIKNSLLDLLALLLEGTQHDGVDSAEALPTPILKSMESMAVNLSVASTSLKDVAQQAGLSVDHFGRLFRIEVGTTPMRWLQKLRIQQSRFLLARTSLFVEEIAIQVGFPDSFHFSRVFKNLVGMNPSEYRKKVRHPPV